MFCSTIIPTIGRTTLARAVESVLSQNFSKADYEVIVVNDSGRPLPTAAWQHSEQVKIIHTNQHNRSVARNTGAAIAIGQYLHFLDDDDWMLPGAFEKFWSLSKSSQAEWLYGAFRLVDNEKKIIAEVYPQEVGNCYIQMLSWEYLPIQASLIKSKAFFKVGGFETLYPFSRVFQDIDLSRKIAHYYQMAQIGEIVCCIRAGDVGSTTNYPDMFLANRQSRENALNTSGASARLRASVFSSPSRSSYWYGRIIYYYLASLKWNVQRKRLLTSASRGIHILLFFAIANRHILSNDFWCGVMKPHLPVARIVIEKSGVNLYANTGWTEE